MKVGHSIALATLALFTLNAPAYASKTDDRIEEAAENSYVFKTYLKEDDIEVESEKGVVTLKGSVSGQFHKKMAAETVEGLPGVKSVDNQLEIKGEQPAENSDAWLKYKLQIALLLHSNVSAGKTEVSVKDGVVTLRGQADNMAQKELTTEYASDIEGVKSVTNEMTVPTLPHKAGKTLTQNVDDASITAQAKMALWMHRSTSALNTTVKSQRGVTTVSGNAKNAAEKDLVTKLVSDINGVKSVKNRMTVLDQ